jgi:O-antigen/teichoic acid export membrane protein
MFKKKPGISNHGLFIAVRFFSEFISRVSSLITFPVFARYLGTEGYGVNAQVNTLISFLVPVVSLGLGYGVVRVVAGKTDRAYISSRFKSTILVIFLTSGLCSLLIILAASWINQNFIKVDGAEEIVIWSAPLVILSSLESSLKDYFRARLRIVAFSLFQIIQTILYVAAVCLVLISGYGLLQVIWAWLVVKLLFLLFSAAYLFYVKDIDLRSPYIPFAELSQLIQYGVPLMIGGLGSWFIQLGDRWIIGYYLDAAQVGIYNAAYTLAAVISALGSPFWSPLYPLMAAAFNKNESLTLKRTCRLYMNAYCFLGFPAFFGLCILSNDLITEIGTQSFSSSPLIFFFIAGGILADQITTVGYYLSYILEKTKFVRNLMLGTALLNLIINLLLVPHIGILGAALATFLAYICMDIVFIVYIRKFGYRLSEVYDLKFISKSLLLSIFMAGIVIASKFLLPSMLASTFAIIAIGAAFYGLAAFLFMKQPILDLIGLRNKVDQPDS